MWGRRRSNINEDYKTATYEIVAMYLFLPITHSDSTHTQGCPFSILKNPPDVIIRHSSVVSAQHPILLLHLVLKMPILVQIDAKTFLIF